MKKNINKIIQVIVDNGLARRVVVLAMQLDLMTKDRDIAIKRAERAEQTLKDLKDNGIINKLNFSKS